MDDRRCADGRDHREPGRGHPAPALADWLDEHGDKHDQARAEFIRLQIEETTAPPGKRREELEKKMTRTGEEAPQEVARPAGDCSGASTSTQTLTNSLCAGCCRLSSSRSVPSNRKLWQRLLPGLCRDGGGRGTLLLGPTSAPRRWRPRPRFAGSRRSNIPRRMTRRLAAFAGARRTSPTSAG